MPSLFQVVIDGFGAHPKSSRTLNEEYQRQSRGLAVQLMIGF
jgi:hypothetical protein